LTILSETKLSIKGEKYDSSPWEMDMSHSMPSARWGEREWKNFHPSSPALASFCKLLSIILIKQKW
jgi:hypothetical protein